MSSEHIHHFVTAKEIGQYLKLSPATVINLTAKGVLQGFKIGKSWRFDREEVVARIAAAKQKAKIAN